MITANAMGQVIARKNVKQPLNVLVGRLALKDNAEMCALPNLDAPTVKSALMEPAFRVVNPILTAPIQKRAVKENVSIYVNNPLLVGKTLYVECQNTESCVYARMVTKEILTLCVLLINVKTTNSVNQTKSATKMVFALILV